MSSPSQLIIRRDSSSTTSLSIERPRALNALTPEIVDGIRVEYTRLIATSTQPHVVILKGSGEKAFCAGGDVKSVVRNAVSGNWQAGVEFFRAEFQLDYLISRLAASSPSIIQIALMDGIVMGGGAGLCMPGPFRVATERTLFSMPECGIGLFPDVGASHFLQRLPAGLGLLLALSGFRLKGPELLWSGLATHFIHSSKLPALQEALTAPCRHTTAPAHAPRHHSSQEAVDLATINTILTSFQEDGVVAGCNTWLPPPPDSTAPDEEPSTQHSVEQRFRSLLAIAERHFCGCTDVAGLLDGLEAAQRQAAAAAAAAPGAGAAPSEELYAEVLQALHQGSPISMCLTLRSMRRGAHSTLREVLRSDFRGVSHCTRHGWDLWEGVTARLVERRPPRWRYSGPALVPQAIVDTAFGPPAFCEELDLAPVDALFRRRGDTPSAKL